MNTKNDPIETLSEIRTMMERSSRFISLSGLSGVSAGIFAVAGALCVWIFGEYNSVGHYSPLQYEHYISGNIYPWFSIVVAMLVLTCAIISGIYFTTRSARKKGLPMWDNTSKRLVVNLFIPLAAGGIFALILISKGYFELVAPITLLFYGIALLNGSKFTLEEIKYLAYTEIVLGLIAAYFTGLGLLFWTLGFGICHIVYGIKMYYKYER